MLGPGEGNEETEDREQHKKAGKNDRYGQKQPLPLLTVQLQTDRQKQIDQQMIRKQRVIGEEIEVSIEPAADQQPEKKGQIDTQLPFTREAGTGKKRAGQHGDQKLTIGVVQIGGALRDQQCNQKAGKLQKNKDRKHRLPSVAAARWIKRGAAGQERHHILFSFVVVQ